MENGNTPINPTEIYSERGFKIGKYDGLTKREYFASLAMQGMLSNSSLVKSINTRDGIEILSETSLIFADEILKQLDK